MPLHPAPSFAGPAAAENVAQCHVGIAPYEMPNADFIYCWQKYKKCLLSKRLHRQSATPIPPLQARHFHRVKIMKIISICFFKKIILLSKNITEHTATGTVAARLTPTIYIYPSPSTPILIFIKRWIATQTLQRLTALHTITIADATPGDMHMQPSHHRENPIAQFSRSKLDISNCLRSLSRIHSGARPTPDHVAPLTGSK